MVHSKKKATTTSKAPAKRLQVKKSHAEPHTQKRKVVEDEDEYSSSSNTEPPTQSRKKRARGSREDDSATVDVEDVEPECVSDSDEVGVSSPDCYAKVDK